MAQAAAVPGVVAATDPFQAKAISADGRYALVQVQFSAPKEDLTGAQRDAYEHIGENASGLRVEHGGDVIAGEVGGSTEGLGVLVAAVVLLVTFGPWPRPG